MSQLERLPTVEEMISALSSPIVPETRSTQQQGELSVDDMIREIWMHTTRPHNVNASVGGRIGRDSSYNSSTDTYDGLPTTSQYNGNGI